MANGLNAPDLQEKINQVEKSLGDFKVFERLEENETILKESRHQIEEYNYSHEERLDALEEQVAELKAKESELAQRWYESDKERERWKRQEIRFEADMERYHASIEQTGQEIESLEHQLIEIQRDRMDSFHPSCAIHRNLLKLYENLGVRVMTEKGKATRVIVGKNQSCVRILDTQHNEIDTDHVWRILYRAMDESHTQFKAI